MLPAEPTGYAVGHGVTPTACGEPASPRHTPTRPATVAQEVGAIARMRLGRTPPASTLLVPRHAPTLADGVARAVTGHLGLLQIERPSLVFTVTTNLRNETPLLEAKRTRIVPSASAFPTLA